jgi:hypothetical protein
MKIKSISIIVATLVIGFVIGFLTNGQITSRKYKRFVSQDHSDVFKHRIIDVIKPDESQLKMIEPILEEYAEEAHQTLAKSKENMKMLHENLLEDLKPHLNEQQIVRLDEAHQRFSKRMRGPRANCPPPRSDRPGN